MPKKPFGKLSKGFRKATLELAKAGNEVGKFTNKELLPGVISAGIPLASTALGVVGQEFGVPASLTSSLSENLMKGYIPKNMQSKNKYVNALGEAMNAGLTGDYDSLADTGLNLLESQTKQKIPQTRYAYNPDNPFEDVLGQMLDKHGINPYIEDKQEISNINESVDARYGDSELGAGADSLTITKSPYQQKEGNADGLLGSGLKKKRKSKKNQEILKVEMVKTLPHKKFSHSANSALDQLLQANAEKAEKKSKDAMSKMVDKQTKALTALGFGLTKLKKINEKPSQDDMDEVNRLNIEIEKVRNSDMRPQDKNLLIKRIDNVRDIHEQDYHKKKSGRDVYNKRLPKDEITDDMEGLGIKKPVKGSKEMKEKMARLRAMRKNK